MKVRVIGFLTLAGIFQTDKRFVTGFNFSFVNINYSIIQGM